MSNLVVKREIDSEPIAVADFSFFVRLEADWEQFRVLRYFDAYNDLVINEQMLDDFEYDIRTFEDSYGLVGGEGPDDRRAEQIVPFIELARTRHAYIVLQGD